MKYNFILGKGIQSNESIKLGENDNVVLFSSVSKNGRDEILNIIEKSLGTN